ncbi:MAG: DUF1570 domain-containing protein [Phycisphaerales bacterium]
MTNASATLDPESVLPRPRSIGEVLAPRATQRERWLATGARVAILGVPLALVAAACRSPRETPPAPAPAPAAVSAPAPLPASAGEDTSPESEETPSIVVVPWSGAEMGGGLDGSLIITRNYHLYSTLRDPRLEELLPNYMDAAFEHYRTAITELPLPSEPLETFIFGSRSEWNRYTEASLPAHEARAMLQLRRGAFTADGKVVLHDLGRTDTMFLTAHEGWHQYTQSIFRDPLPIWLEEGIAAYMEGHRYDSRSGEVEFIPWRNLERFGELRSRGRRGELIELDVLLDRTPQQFLSGGTNRLLTYYAQLWALVQFLVHGEDGRYRAGLECLLEDAVEGRIGRRLANAGGYEGRRRAMGSGYGRAVLGVYFSEDYEAFKREYEAFVELMMRRGAGTAVWRGTSPVAEELPQSYYRQR